MSNKVAFAGGLLLGILIGANFGYESAKQEQKDKESLS